jgi:hypothetical protein
VKSAPQFTSPCQKEFEQTGQGASLLHSATCRGEWWPQSPGLRTLQGREEAEELGRAEERSHLAPPSSPSCLCPA